MSQVSFVVLPVLASSPVVPVLEVVSKVVSEVSVSPVDVDVPSIVVSGPLVSAVVALEGPVLLAPLELAPLAPPLPVSATPLVGPVVLVALVGSVEDAEPCPDDDDDAVPDPPSVSPGRALQPASATPITNPTTVRGAGAERRPVPQNGHAGASRST